MHKFSTKHYCQSFVCFTQIFITFEKITEKFLTMKKVNSIPTIGTWGEDIFPQLSWFKSDNLKRANVMVVGCGALGNEVLKNLTLFGAGHLVIVDFDTVEASNLTRSILFRENDAKSCREKSIVAAERIKEINSSIKVLPITGNICHDIGLGLLRRMNVVIGCLDNRWARYCLNRLCMRAGIPWVDGGIDGLEGTARVFSPGKNCYACNLGPEALKDLSYRLSCSSVIRKNEEAKRVPTTPIIASIIGAVEAQEAVKLLHPDELENGELTSLCGKMFYYDGQHPVSRIMDFAGYDDDCPVHEMWTPIRKCDISINWTIGKTLDYLSELFECKELEILFTNHCFVDYLITRKDEQKIPVMLPDYAVGEFIEGNPSLSHLPFHAFYQHEIKCIGNGFPYKEITLKEAGFPNWDVLHVRTAGGNHFVELVDQYNYSEVIF